MKGGGGGLSAILKRDDDAKFVLIHDERSGTTETYLETNQDKLMNSTPAPTPSNAAEETLLDPPLLLPDVRVRVISNMFLIHGLIIMSCFLFGLPLYFLQPSHQTSVIILIISCITFGITYVCTLAFSQTKVDQRIIVAFGVIWSLAAIGMVGTTAALMKNIAAFQLMLILWIQTMTVYGYCKVSPRFISTKYAMLWMSLSTMVVWLVSIAAFSVDHDWVAAIVIVVVAALCVGYNGLQIRMTEGRYSMSLDDAILSIVQFYGDPVLWIFYKCGQQKTSYQV